MNMVPQRGGLNNSRLTHKDMVTDLERVEGVHTTVQPARRAQDRAFGDVAVSADGDGNAGRVGLLRLGGGVCGGGS